MAKRILIIDDEPEVVAYLKDLYESYGYLTSTAKDGVEGLEIAKRDKPDLISLDIDMPERDQLIAANKSMDEMREYLEVDSLGFLSVEGLYRARIISTITEDPLSVDAELMPERTDSDVEAQALRRAALERLSALGKISGYDRVTDQQAPRSDPFNELYIRTWRDCARYNCRYCQHLR